MRFKKQSNQNAMCEPFFGSRFKQMRERERSKKRKRGITKQSEIWTHWIFNYTKELMWIVRLMISQLHSKNSYLLETHMRYIGLPLWLSGEESTCQCRRCGFDPWVGKIPWRRKWQPSPVFKPGESHGQRRLAYTVHELQRIEHDLAVK